MFSILSARALHVPKALSRSPCRFVAHRRFPSRSRQFHRTSKHCIPKGTEDGAEPIKGVGDHEAPTEESNTSEPIASGVPATLASEKSKDLVFYGSAARRVLRRRPTKERAPTAAIQEWFMEHNVYVKEDLSGLRLGSGIQLVRGDLAKGYVRWPPKPPSDNDNFVREHENPAPVDKEGLDGTRPESLQEKVDSNTDFSDKKYFLDIFQWMEITHTARGLLKLPEPSFSGEVAMEKSHLILHYPEEGGAIFLDKVGQKLARFCGCDLIVLDAQDISELVATSQYEVEDAVSAESVAQAGRLLSYEVYHKPNATSQSDRLAEFMDVDEESENPTGSQTGLPMIIAKPISLNVSDLFAPARGRSRGAKNSLSGFFADAEQRQNSKKHILFNLVNTILSALDLKRNTLKASTGPRTAEATDMPENAITEGSETEAAKQNSDDSHRSDGLIVHIRDLRSIQETSFGKQFLSALYEGVQGRRKNGQKVMIFGTEMGNEEKSSYTRNRIEEIQRDELGEISRTILLTPVTPNTEARLALLEDRRVRTRIINTRHFFEMLRYKNPSVLEELPAGFWKSDPINYLSTLDVQRASSSVWSFGEVHRLVSLLTGMIDAPSKRNMNETLIHRNSMFEAFAYISASDEAKFRWAEESSSTLTRTEPGSESLETKDRARNARLNTIRKQLSRHEKKLLGGVVEPDKIRTTFNDVHLPVETIDTLKTLTTLSLIRPEAFLYGVLASDRIPGLMLYGPPGTGKTLLAKAVAKESGATMIEVSGAEINDMYVGEGEKNVKALFSLAKKLSPSVIFLDEADALFSTRGGGRQRVSHRELLNQFLKEWDGMSNDSSSAFIMVATNRPMDLDDAVLRRLPRRLLVDLPTEADRLEILRIHLREEQLADDVNLSDPASKTPFYSGSDLKNLCVAAALNCVRDENEAANSHKSSDGEPYKHPEKRTLAARHFSKALEEITASITEDMNSLKEIKKFDAQYGDKRGKKKAPKWGFETLDDAKKVLDTVKVRA